VQLHLRRPTLPWGETSRSNVRRSSEELRALAPKRGSLTSEPRQQSFFFETSANPQRWKTAWEWASSAGPCSAAAASSVFIINGGREVQARPRSEVWRYPKEHPVACAPPLPYSVLSLTPGRLPLVNSTPLCSSALRIADTASSETRRRSRSKSTTVESPKPEAFAKSGCVQSMSARPARHCAGVINIFCWQPKALGRIQISTLTVGRKAGPAHREVRQWASLIFRLISRESELRANSIWARTHLTAMFTRESCRRLSDAAS